MPTYTIESQGPRWVASDGVTHCESDEPRYALEDLLIALGPSGEEALEAVRDGERIIGDTDRLDRLCVTLIRLTAVRAPAHILRSQAALIEGAVEELIGAREAEGDDGR